VICPFCGERLDGGARFCGGCGRAVLSTETALTASPAVTAAPPAGSLVGREIAGRYRILTKLGEGGMGAVYRAEQLSLKRVVALKVLRPDLVADPQLLRRFNAEAELVGQLHHPNTVSTYDFGTDDDGSLFIAMEFIDGRSLRQALVAEAPFAPVRALTVAAQITASIAEAHALNIVHRDLKPDNVILQTRGRRHDVVRVLDFGIAKLRDDSRAAQAFVTAVGDLLGTPHYMSPEQIRGEAIDGRTDIYSLGCVLYEMLTGRMPFEGANVTAIISKHLLDLPVAPSQRRPDLGLASVLDDLVLAALAKDPAARPASMELFGEQLATLVRMMPGGDAAAANLAELGDGGFTTGRVFDTGAPAPSSRAGGLVPGDLLAGQVPATIPDHPLPATQATAPDTIVSPPRFDAPAATPARRRRGLLIGLAALAAIGGGLGVFAATRSAAPGSPAGADPKAAAADHPAPPTPPTPTPTPTPAPPTPTPPGPPIPDPTLPGEVLTARTFAIRLPVGAQALHTTDGSLGGTLDGVILTVAPTPPTLAQTARDFERRTGLRLMDQHQEAFAGHDYTVLDFAGMLHNTTAGYIGVGVAFLDRDPALGALVLFPAELASDPHTVELVDEFLHRRITLLN
jgi:serine/threonine-protein kinase